MKISIDRDSVCMGDDFGHQQTIECSENETLESLMNKILQSNFFPVENLNKVTKKWKVKINNHNILTYFPNENKVNYHIDKNTTIKNLKNQNIYFKEIASNKTNIIDLLTFPFIFLFIILRSIYIETTSTIFKLKQQKWTHIVLPLYAIFILSFIIATLYDITIHDFYLSYFVILCGAALCPFFVCITIVIIVLLKLLSIKFKNFDKINNKFLLQNLAYNILWLIGMFILLFDLCFFVFRYLPAIF